MASGSIEVVTGAPGSMTATIADPAGNPLGPPNFIRVGDAWRVDFTWAIGGLIPFLTGTWKLQVVLEGMGAPPPADTEASVGTAMVPGQTAYPASGAPPLSVNFPAGSFALGTEDSLSFHAVALLTAKSGTGTRYPLGGMVDLGLVDIIA